MPVLIYDHWITLSVAIVVVGITWAVSSLPWYWLLIFGICVSGLVELAIESLPVDPEDISADNEQG